jgi:hypothetical protein
MSKFENPRTVLEALVHEGALAEPALSRARAALACPDAAVEAISFATARNTEDGLVFLELWNHGEFDKIRKEWPEAPDDVFKGADIFFGEELAEKAA